MSNKNMFLYWGSGSGPCVRVIAVLAEKGLWEDCPNKLIEFSKKEHKTEEVLKINPRGQVPTFKDGDNVINESVAICLYLENKYSNDYLTHSIRSEGERSGLPTFLRIKKSRYMGGRSYNSLQNEDS